jgi:hypothetical protein
MGWRAGSGWGVHQEFRTPVGVISGPGIGVGPGPGVHFPVPWQVLCCVLLDSGCERWCLSSIPASLGLCGPLCVLFCEPRKKLPLGVLEGRPRVKTVCGYEQAETPPTCCHHLPSLPTCPVSRSMVSCLERELLALPSPGCCSWQGSWQMGPRPRFHGPRP